MSLQHFILIKQRDHTPAGIPVSARVAATKILDGGLWPLWDRTPCKRMVKAGDRVAVYLAGQGNQIVVASATIADRLDWTPSMGRKYPLSLAGTPSLALSLTGIQLLRPPVQVRPLVPRLSFGGNNNPKWGANFMGGMRLLSPADFRLLTGEDRPA